MSSPGNQWLAAKGFSVTSTGPSPARLCCRQGPLRTGIQAIGVGLRLRLWQDSNLFWQVWPAAAPLAGLQPCLCGTLGHRTETQHLEPIRTETVNLFVQDSNLFPVRWVHFELAALSTHSRAEATALNFGTVTFVHSFERQL